MVRIRKVEISHFRSIKSLNWTPANGINCLVGPGDSGKSTILDAIDLCLSARRSAGFADTDFFQLHVKQPIVISLTIGELPDALLNLETYGEFLRGFDSETGEVEDEPRAALETVLTFRLSVSSDLEALWALYSVRAEAAGLEKALAWKDRAAISPARIGSYASTNLSWTRGSVLNRLTEERPNLGADLAKAAREARSSFGTAAATQLAASLKLVTDTASELGVPVGGLAQALLDAHSVSIGDGAIALHNASGIPLRSLGTGSSRLLIAGLQRAAAEAATIALVDEVEYGLEPHRLTRLLHSLGAKESKPPLQVFMTTHSPVAVRELSGDQLFVVRAKAKHHDVLHVGTTDDVQSTVRADPEAFLAKSVVVCEGASEVGFARGLDQYWVDGGSQSFFALGGAFVNVGGSDADKVYVRGTALALLGYRVLVLADSDKAPSAEVVEAFAAAGGEQVVWRSPRTLEDELFHSLSDESINLLVDKAVEFVGEGLVNDNIQSESGGKVKLQGMLDDADIAGFSPEAKKLLGAASRKRNSGWFKSVTRFEVVAQEVVGPGLVDAEKGFVALVRKLKRWMHAA
jgi:putative ATP-dependent endonuclease of OLD family